MLSSKLRIGSLFGVPIFVHWTILLAITGILLQLGMAGLIVSAALFSSVLVHEYAHALTARRYGVHTNGITLHYFGGTASMEILSVTPKQEALISIAGPVVNITIAILAFGCNALWSYTVTDNASPLGEMTILTILGAINVVIAAFNMLPILPLDGGRVVRAGLQIKLGRHNATRTTLTISVIMSAMLLILSLTKIHTLIVISSLLLAYSLFLRRSYGIDDQVI